MGRAYVAIRDQAFVLMDRWLAAIEADHSGSSLATKVIRDNPADAVDACFIGGVKVTDLATCRAAFPSYSLPRLVAGELQTNDMIPGDLSSVRRISVALRCSQVS